MPEETLYKIDTEWANTEQEGNPYTLEFRPVNDPKARPILKTVRFEDRSRFAPIEEGELYTLDDIEERCSD